MNIIIIIKLIRKEGEYKQDDSSKSLELLLNLVISQWHLITYATNFLLSYR